MSTELAGGGESSIQLPSFEDIQKDLKRVRQQEGASVRRISTYGQRLQQLRISQDEFRRSGSQPGTLPMATIAALECAVRVYKPESTHFMVLDNTLNFRSLRANLTERQQNAMDAIGVYSKTTYEYYENNSYKVFAYDIQQQAESFCRRKNDAATAIANLPFEHRVALIQMLLDVRLSMLPVNQNVLAEDVLRALPGLATVPPLDGMEALQKVDRAIIVLIRSERYRDARQANTTVPEAAFHIIQEIARHYDSRRRHFASPGNPRLASWFDSVLASRLREGRRESVDPTSLPNFGELSELTKRDLKRLKRGGRFSKRAKPTPRFDRDRFSGIGFLASLLVEIDQSNAWKELFGQSRYSKPQPSPAKPTETKKPDRPRRIWKSRESD